MEDERIFFGEADKAEKMSAQGEIKMINTNKNIDSNDPFDLTRFTVAQEGIYDQVLSELRNGRKRSHWMWFIFPQINGLGHSPTAKRYAVKSEKEAREYLAHPILGARLVECATTVSNIEGRTASQIFGSPDDVKLRSSMTLFASITEPQSIFDLVLDKFFNGHQDPKTLTLLEAMNKNKDE
jgi:uncharacterized protein (DUF1810 family)